MEVFPDIVRQRRGECRQIRPHACARWRRSGDSNSSPLGSILSFAVRRRLRKDKPVHGIENHPGRKSERLVLAREFERLGVAIQEANCQASMAGC